MASPTFSNILKTKVPTPYRSTQSSTPMINRPTQTSTLAWQPPSLPKNVSFSNGKITPTPVNNSSSKTGGSPTAGLTATQQSDNNAYLASKGYDAAGKAMNPSSNTTPPVTTPPITTATGDTTDYKSLYQKVVQDQANQQNSQYNQQTKSSVGTLQGIASGSNPAQSSIAGLQNIAANQTPAVTGAQEAYNKFAQSSPYMIQAQSNPNVAADVASGRSSLLGQTFGAILGAKGQAVSNALAGQGQQISAGSNAGTLGLTGQSQQISAAQGAGNLAQTGQATAQSALSSAAGYAAPKSAGSGYVQIDPQTGLPLTGAGQAAFAGGQTEAQQTMGGQYAQAQGNISGAQNQLSSLSQLIQKGNLNPSGINLANEGIQTIEKNLSNSDYTTLMNTLDTIGKALGVDLVTANNQQGGSLINTINNAINAARAQAEGLKTGTQQTTTGQNNTIVQSTDSKGNPTAMSF